MTGLYHDLATAAFLAELPEVVDTLDRAVPAPPGPERDWVVYGSRVTGTATATSDIDVLMLHHDSQRPPVRVDARHDGVAVTVYVLPWAALLADGEQRSYGGYFALKLFSPFVCVAPGRDAELVRVVARFLGPLAAHHARGCGATERTRHQVLADSYLAFLDLHPDFDSYTARALARPLLSSPMWLRQAQVTVDAYVAAGIVQQVRAGRYSYVDSAAADDWGHERAIAAARFWAFGAVCHGGDAGFPDHYRSKARSRTTALDRQRTVEEIRRIARGRS